MKKSSERKWLSGQNTKVDNFIMSMKKLFAETNDALCVNLDLGFDIFSKISIKGKITLYNKEDNSTTTITFADGGKITTLTTEVFRGDN